MKKKIEDEEIEQKRLAREISENLNKENRPSL
jgi:hypothetical protein